MGKAIFSNIISIIESRNDNTYHTKVKTFRATLRRQKIIPRTYAGEVEKLIEANVITAANFNRIFQFHWQNADYHFAEATVFFWE